MSSKDIWLLEGVIIKSLGFNAHLIKIRDDKEIVGRFYKNSRKHRKQQVHVGDRVRVKVSPYDTSHGIISGKVINCRA